jgi:hypothetical protein
MGKNKRTKLTIRDIKSGADMTHCENAKRKDAGHFFSFLNILLCPVLYAGLFTERPGRMLDVFV